jgi:hypothetical protein
MLVENCMAKRDSGPMSDVFEKQSQNELTGSLVEISLGKSK